MAGWSRTASGTDRRARGCWAEGSLATAEGKLQIARCMRRKYDEGVRAE